MIVEEITDEKLAEIRAASCSTLVQSLVRRLDRVEQEREFLRDNADILDYNALEYLKTIDRVQEENTALRERVNKLEAENANLVAATKGKTFFHSDAAVNEEMGRLRKRVKRLEEAIDQIALMVEEESDIACVIDTLKEGE